MVPASFTVSCHSSAIEARRTASRHTRHKVGSAAEPFAIPLRIGTDGLISVDLVHRPQQHGVVKRH
jgi:hypothetical protein